MSGDIRRLTDRVAVLDQHVGLLDPAASILDNLRRLNPELTGNEAHAALARFAFRNRAALQIAGTLSGGERLRAGMACVFARPQPPFLLLLDEPTNHLDLASIEELEHALSGFDGALIVISHDQAFLQAIGIQREIVALGFSYSAAPAVAAADWRPAVSATAAASASALLQEQDRARA